MDTGQIILFQTHGGNTKIEFSSLKSLWVSVDQTEEWFFNCNKSTIQGIKDIYESSELEQNRTVAFFATVQE